MRNLPSVDAVMRDAGMEVPVGSHGRQEALRAVRLVLAELRGGEATSCSVEDVIAAAADLLQRRAASNMVAVYNLTGTVLHTNLGRALLAEEAIEAAVRVMRQPVALEFDLGGGRRGERDDVLRELLRELTGAEDATVVNNNAAAVLIALNTFAQGKRAIVSRGELIEIGGAFRLPEIMRRAGARLSEIGTTNRTHLRDYEEALREPAGAVLKVHTSNYRVEGFTADVSARDLAGLAGKASVPLINDLGSGTLVDLSAYGLPREPTVREAVADGADLVTFSGDKLLGGPQAGFIVGRKEFIARINRNPLKRSLRIDKVRLAALEATLRLYRNPERLAARLPTLRALARPANDIGAVARRVAPAMQRHVGAEFRVAIEACASQVGSGSVPAETLPSMALAFRPVTPRQTGRAIERLSQALRALPIPIIGRVAKDALFLDLRCLEDEAAFLANLEAFRFRETNSVSTRT